MRTSRISKETARAIDAARGITRRTTRSSLLQENADPTESSTTSPDIEDAIPNTLKRKHGSTSSTPVRKAVRTVPKNPAETKTEIKTEVEDTLSFSPSKPRRERKPARNVKNEETGEVEIHPPSDWKEMYDCVKEMRLNGSAQNAAVDTMGCERLHEEKANPRDKRFHTLIALMLSSQTKDTTNAVVMRKLQTELPACEEGAPIGLNLENILAVDPKLLNEMIWAVGFHNNKTKYIKAAAEILRDQWKGDIPDTIEGLMALPGVGPKMGYLCLSSAWGKTEGIGVDVHVHRIANLWGWCQTKEPEKTRLSLQGWLPKELWREINWLLVGFGQTVCLPVGRKCGSCELGLQGLCKAADRGKIIAGRKMKEEMVVKDEDGDVVQKKEVTESQIKIEDGILDKGDGAEKVEPEIHLAPGEVG